MVSCCTGSSEKNVVRYHQQLQIKYKEEFTRVLDIWVSITANELSGSGQSQKIQRSRLYKKSCSLSKDDIDNVIVEASKYSTIYFLLRKTGKL